MSNDNISAVTNAEGVGEDAAAVAVAVPVDLATITNVWDYPKVTKSHDESGKKVWTCGWCGSVFKLWNATKALAHLARISKQDIKVCFANIPTATSDSYKALWHSKTAKKAASVVLYKRSCELLVESQKLLALSFLQ